MSKSPSARPYIFDAQFPLEPIPPGFNAVKLSLECRMRSAMDWKMAKEAAHKWRKDGYNILWELRMGLFGDLDFPLDHEMQFKSLCLALEHFVTDLWKEYEDCTLGVFFYRGPLNFSRKFPWDQVQRNHWQEWLREGFKEVEEFNQETGLQLTSFAECSPDLVPTLAALFCQDVGANYLSMLSQKLPDKLKAYLCLDASQDQDLLLQAQLLNRERFEHFHLIVKGSMHPIEFAWESKVFAEGQLARYPYPIPASHQSSWGVCLPSLSMKNPYIYASLQQSFEHLRKKQIPYRIIPESHLTSEWEGLDYLIIVPEAVTPQGQRKLQGFAAAGGTIVKSCQLIEE